MEFSRNSEELTAKKEEDRQVLSNEGSDILMVEGEPPTPIKQDRSGANGAQGWW